MENPLSLISLRLASLSQSERSVADYVLRNPSDVVLLSLQALAQRCQTSDSTVLRFCRSLGYSGYQDFRSALIPHLLRQGAMVHEEFSKTDTMQQLATKYVTNLSQDLTRTLERCESDTFDHVVRRIASANLVVVVGLAGSAGVGRIFQSSLVSIGKMAVLLSDRVEIERTAAITDPGDVVVGISHSGETSEVCMGLERARQRGAFTVGITNSSPSQLDSVSDALLLTVVPENLLGSYSGQPRIVQLALLELIVHLVAARLVEEEEQEQREHARR